MLKQIDLKTAMDLVLFEAEEVKMIRPAEHWKDAKLESLNDTMNELDEAIFLYEMPDEKEETPNEAEPFSLKKEDKEAPEKENATKLHVKPEPVQKNDRNIHKVTDEEEKEMAKLRIAGESVINIAKRFEVAENTVRTHLANYEKNHPNIVNTYYRQERPCK